MNVMILAVIVLGIASGVRACRSGWIQHGEKCYHFSHDPEQWADAEMMCRVFGGHLASIDSYSENNFIRGQADKMNAALWIGGTDWQVENEWRWVATLYTFGYTNWHSGEPNNDSGLDNCVQIYEDGTWDDADCRVEKYYVCEDSGESAPIVGK